MMKLNIQFFASGTIEFPQAGSSYKTIRGKIEWSESEVSIENNTSKIHTKLYAKVGTGGTTGRQWSGNVNVAGNNHTFSSLDSSTTIKGTYVLLKEYDDTITHENDGSKKITISGSVTGPSGTTIANVTSSGSQEVTLATIPRASEITATNADIGSSSIIVINKKNDSFTTTLKYKFASQTAYTTIVDKTSEKTYGWQIPTSFYALIPNSRYGSCSIQATTYNGNEQVGDAKYVDINIFANETLCRPIISGTSIIDTNEKSVALTGNNTKFIKYVSTPKLTWNASAKNSATLKSQTINNVNATSPYQSNWAESFKLNVVDTREYSNTYNFIFPSVVNYFYPQITASGKRKTSTSSNIILNVSGKFFNGYFSDTNKNTATFECKYKRKTDSDWTSVTIEPTINEDGTFTLSNYDLGEICNYQTSCQFSIVITDKVKSESSNFSITVGEPNHYWYKKNDLNHFRVNGQLDLKNTLNMFNHNSIYWKEIDYGDKFAIVPMFNGTGDSNYLSIQAAIGEAGTDPDLYGIAAFHAQSGNVWLKGQLNTDSNVVASGNITANGFMWAKGQRVPVFNGWCADANNALYEGRYYTGNGCLNVPGSYPWGYLRVRVSNGDTINHSDNWGWQEFYNTAGEKYIRHVVNNSGWSAWRRITDENVLKAQSVLWEGAEWMGAYSINLNQLVSAQKTGIVLIFSGWSNNAVQNNNHTCYFIPKSYLNYCSGGGVLIPMGETDGVKGSKYIYIHDDHLTGNANNQTDNNKKWALTQVIGV